MARLAKNSLKIVYSDQEMPQKVNKSIFLAGPTPRNNNVKSWRTEAIEILKRLDYTGTVYVPEPSSGVFNHSYDDQVGWELSALNRADIIVFWVPRSDEMPAFTTNIEFGTWISSGKVVFGYPPDAERMRYLEYLSNENNVKSHPTLEDTLKNAVQLLHEGADREGGETQVPLYIWKTKSFQNWYSAQKQAGNKLENAKLLFNSRVGPNKNIVFLWILQVDVYIASEDRNKTIEFVVSRTNTTATLLYKKAENIFDTEIVIVKEFRSPAATKDGYVWELPGGSSNDDMEEMKKVASDEIREELGFELSKDRLKFVQERQVNSTLLANKVSLFTAELSDEEIEWFKSQKGIKKGNIEDTEVTYTEVLTLKQILEADLVDWLNVGMIMKALTI